MAKVGENRQEGMPFAERNQRRTLSLGSPAEPIADDDEGSLHRFSANRLLSNDWHGSMDRY